MIYCEITRKAVIKSTPDNVLLSVGYCKLDILLINHNPIAYNSGRYGWNFNVYEIYGITICTGHRNLPKTTATKLAIRAADYETKAKEILNNKTYKVACDMIEELLKEFCAQA